MRQLKELEKRLKRWRAGKKTSFQEFTENLEKQDSIIHNMLVATQAAIDLGNTLIEKKNLQPPSTYAEIFAILGKSKLISKIQKRSCSLLLEHKTQEGLQSFKDER